MAISELVRALLAARGVEEEAAINAFLSPEYDAHTHDPFLMCDMEAAVDRVFHAMRENERIAVYADFDCDGIPGASILADTFKKIGYADVETYIPHRDREGYGFHIDAIDTLAARGVKLIITVDVGTVAFDACVHAKEIGIDVIVTDHHELAEKLPDAFAVLNPKRAPYPFPHLCGAGVAFKLACALLYKGKQLKHGSFAAIPDGWEKWLLDLVAIATVADMVPLVGENRVLVFWGLRVLRKSQRPGITALTTLLRLRKAELTEDDIGFSIAPRINAASRMDDPEIAYRLLTTRDEEEAQTLASSLENLNTKRKGAASAIVRHAKKNVHARFTDEEKVVVAGDPSWKPALLGLAANSVLADRSGVVCLWGRDANGNLKGSCRSDGTISLAELFARARDVFEECGGHAASGGFSVSHERVHELHERLARAAAELAADALHADAKQEEAEHDAQVSLAEVAWPLFKEVVQVAPFGKGNEKPVFLIRDAVIISVRTFGKEDAHVEVVFGDGRSSDHKRAFDFFRKPEDFSCTPVVGARVDVLATLERDAFRPPVTLALRLVDVRLPQ